jgi:Ca-activated chloride channel family protein
LWLFVLVAALVVWYVVTGLRRPRYAVRFSNLELLDKVAPRRPGWRRHVPAAFVVVALSSLVVAVAQPMGQVKVPKEQATVVLALDTSLSMGATDVEPNRLAAAQAGAKRFLQSLPPDVNVALVSFAGASQVLVPPTTDRDQVKAAIDGLELTQSTAIGDAVDLSRKVLEDRDVAGQAGAVVLLSDGGTTIGVSSEEAAARAKEAGVVVSTIAYGTPEGTVTIDANKDGTVEDVPVPVNKEELAKLAEVTGGQAYTAETDKDLASVFERLGSKLGYTTERREVSAWFVAVGMAALVVAALASLHWFQRLL